MEKRFYYNNSATYMLSAVVSRVAGMTALDLLDTEIFRHIGIRNVSWPTLDGNSEGCAGLHVCSDDIAKVMQIYQNGGVYNGRRYLSEEWVKMATKVQRSTAHDNNFRWYTNGYGYQMWHNWRGGYRAQGSGGQYGYVFPDLDIVAGIESSCKTADEIFDTYYSFFSDFAGESTISARELEAYIHSMYPPLGQVAEFEGFEQCYEMEPNAMGITRLHLHREEDAVACVFSDGKSVQTMRFGIGNWQENKVYACNFRPQIYSLTVPRREIVHFCASCKDGQDGVLEVMLRFRDCHHAIMLYITAEEQIQLRFDSQDLCPEATLLKGIRRK